MADYLAGVELGGTTCVAAISKLSEPTNILDRFDVPTGDYPSTLEALTGYLRKQLKELNIESFVALGIASFGPLDLQEDSKTYGFITSTPKQRWRNADIVGVFKREFGKETPIALETDVNAPAMAEMSAIVAATTPKTLPTVVYITVGTGVGVGITVGGFPVHGLLHPEGGHIIVPRMPGDDYKGCCAFGHDCCVEGMVDSQAIAERASVDRQSLHTIPDDSKVWDTVSYYLGSLCLNITYLLSPHVIILGGGIMKRHLLYTKTRAWFKALLREYLNAEQYQTDKGLMGYIREPHYGEQAGIVGALELAKQKCSK